MATARAPKTSSRSASGPSATAAATRSATSCGRRSRRSTPSRCSARSAPGASTSTTTTSCRSTPRPPSAIGSSRTSQRACAAAPPRRADGDRQSVLRPGLPRRRLHGQRPARACLRACRRRCARWISAPSSARRSSCCGADARARRPTRAGGPTRPSSGCAEAVELSLRVLDRPEVRLSLRARGEAERAARRHLHGDDRQLPRASSRRSRTPSSSASTRKSRTNRWPA